MEARLHRGKLALRQILATQLSEEAEAYGLIAPADAGWLETRIWCPGCGKRRLEGRLDTEHGRFLLRCAACSPTFYPHYVNSFMGKELKDVRTYRPALNRVLQTIDRMFRTDLVDGRYTCHQCGSPIPLRVMSDGAICLECPGCDFGDYESWHSITWSLPAVQEFWRLHPRMRFIPEREIERDGLAAVVTRFESIASSERIDVIMRQDTASVLGIHGPTTL